MLLLIIKKKINSYTFETKIITLEEAKTLLNNNTLTVTTLQTLLKETSGEEVVYSKKIAMYGFSNGKTIMMIHDYSKTKTDVDGENYLLCLEITALFEISAYVGELKISKRFEDLIKRQIGDEYIHVEYNLHDRIKTDNSDNDTDLKPFLKKLEFELETITNDEFNEKTSIEEGQETTKYCRLAVIIDVTSILRVHVEIITLDGESWYLRAYDKDNVIKNRQCFKVLSGWNDVQNKIGFIFQL